MCLQSVNTGLCDCFCRFLGGSRRFLASRALLNATRIDTVPYDWTTCLSISLSASHPAQVRIDPLILMMHIHVVVYDIRTIPR